MIITDILGGMGGAERNLYLLANGLRERGHRVIVSCMKCGNVSNLMKNEGFNVEELNIEKIYSYKGIKAFFRLLKIIRTEKVSVILTYHNISDYVGFLLSFLGRCSIVSNRRDMGFSLKARDFWLYRRINNFYDGIVAVSEAVKRSIIKEQKASSEKIVVIPNGISIPISEKHITSSNNGRLEKIIDSQSINICCLANLRPIKGQEYLIEAAGLIVHRFPNVRFYFVGQRSGMPGYYSKLTDRIKKLGLEKIIFFTGKIEHSHVMNLMNYIDIVILPSLSEGMSNVLLEAMSAGKPIIATTVGGNVEVVKEGETGFLIPPEDPKAIATALIKLLENPLLRHKMGSNALERVRLEFSLSKMIDKYEDFLLYAVLKKRRGHFFKYNFQMMYQKIKLGAKLIVSLVVYYLGFVAIYTKFKRIFGLGKAQILCFHDISIASRVRKNLSIQMDPEEFIQIIEFLINNYEVRPLNEVTGLMKNKGKLGSNVFSITFDDCYKGWAEHVLPICQRRQVPFSVFLNTDCLDTCTLLLYDSLIFMVENTWRKVADLSKWNLGTFLIDFEYSIDYFLEKTMRSLRILSQDEQSRTIKELSDYFETPLNTKEALLNLLNWDDVHRLLKFGVTIGIHTKLHSDMSVLSKSESQLDISQCRKRLEDELKCSIDIFAYPYGNIDNVDYNVLKEAGIRYAYSLHAYSLRNTKNTRFKPYNIPRHITHAGMFYGLNGKINKARMAVEFSGLGDILFSAFSTLKRKV